MMEPTSPLKKKQKAKPRKPPSKTDLFTLHIGKLSGFAVVKEFKFHPARQWRLDYAIPDRKVAVEVEGGVWTEGRHTRGSGFVKDMEKYNELACLGWLLIRCTPSKLFTSKNFENVQKCIEIQNKHQIKLP